MGGKFLSLLSTKAINLVLSGTKIVLVLCAYWSLKDARRLSENKSLENRAVSSACPMAEMINFGIWVGDGWFVVQKNYNPK